jgi:hypothetical protein
MSLLILVNKTVITNTITTRQTKVIETKAFFITPIC